MQSDTPLYHTIGATQPALLLTLASNYRGTSYLKVTPQTERRLGLTEGRVSLRPKDRKKAWAGLRSLLDPS